MIIIGAILWFIISVVVSLINVALNFFGLIPISEVTTMVMWLMVYIPICTGDN